MKYCIYMLVVLDALVGCTSLVKNERAQLPDKENAVKEYFENRHWSYPLQLDSGQLVWFTHDTYQIFTDSNAIQQRRKELFMRGVRYYMRENDGADGHWFTRPVMYQDSGTRYYTLFVEKYRNNRHRNAGCECESLDSNRVFGYGNVMIFRVLADDSLLFTAWGG